MKKDQRKDGSIYICGVEENTSRLLNSKYCTFHTSRIEWLNYNSSHDEGALPMQRLWNLTTFWQSENKVIAAIKRHDYVELRNLLQADFDANAANTNGETPLSVAMNQRDIKALRILLCASNAVITPEHIYLAANLILNFNPEEAYTKALIAHQITSLKEYITYAEFKKAVRENERDLVTAYIYQNKMYPEEMEKIRDVLAVAQLKCAGGLLSILCARDRTKVDYADVFEIMDETLGQQDPEEGVKRAARVLDGKQNDFFADSFDAPRVSSP